MSADACGVCGRELAAEPHERGDRECMRDGYARVVAERDELLRTLDRERQAGKALVARLATDDHCRICNHNLGKHWCWQSDGGESCMRVEGHDGPHKCVMSGWWWERSEPNDKPCGYAPLWEGLRCSLPGNHDGPHNVPPRQHGPDCAIAAYLAAALAPTGPAGGEHG